MTTKCPSSSSYPWLDDDILLKLQIQEWETEKHE